MNPICYPALQLSSLWTYEPDSQTGGSCKITSGTATTPMQIAFAPHAGKPWSNAYILHRHSGSLANRWAYITNVTFPTQQDITNLNAYEQDFQKNDGPMIFNFGWQFLAGTGLRLWDRSVPRPDGKFGAWQSPILSQNAAIFKPGIPRRFVMEFSHDAASVTYLGVSIDGVWMSLNITYPALAHQQSPYVNNAVQLDSLGKGAPINMLLNECNLVGF